MSFRPLHSTPLTALEGVVVDTETTGLDANKARMIQIGAVRVVGDRMLPDQVFDRLADPGSPIPPASTKVHGLSDADVAGAASPNEVLVEFEAWRGEAVIIGHTIGFDLAMLKREADIAGRPYPRPRALDVRHLARLARPTLASYSLDRLCDWLEVEIEGRHTAIGDALATAEVYLKLLPLLREAGIRTLAEAEAQTRSTAERTARMAGDAFDADPWAGAWRGVEDAAGDTGAMARIDSYPYRHQVRDLMSCPPLRLTADAPLRDALSLLVDRNVSSVFVAAETGGDGIVTERDVLRALEKHGAEGLNLPLSSIRTAPLQTVPEDAFVYRAIGRMDRMRLRHLGVTDASGALIGAVSARDLMHHRSSAAMVLGDEILAAGDETALGRAWAQAPLMCRQLLDESVDPRTIANVISAELRALTHRAAELTLERMAADGEGAPPCAFSLLVLGSAGRGESLLATDQDNAIIFAEGEPDGPEDAWFARFAEGVTGMLDRVGLRACPEKVMATNPVWRKSLAAWTAEIDDWEVRSDRRKGGAGLDPRFALLFDASCVYGDGALADAVWAHAFERATAAEAVRRQLTAPLRDWRSPVNVFGALKLEGDNRLDLKKAGLMPIFTAARALAVKADAKLRGTPERLRAAAADGLVWSDRVEPVIDAHQMLLGALLAQQIADIETGAPLGCRVDPRGLDKHSRAELREALSAVESAIGLI